MTSAAPLTKQDVMQVLAVAAAFDRRVPSETALAVWTDALNLAGPFPRLDAIEAVKRHYATSTDYLMPAHVGAYCRERMRERRAALPPAGEFMADVDTNDPAWLSIRRSRERALLDAMVTDQRALGGAQ
jgi:hypothetical protein